MGTLLAALVLMTGACGPAPSPSSSAESASPPASAATSPGPTGTPGPATEVLLAEIRDAVSRIRGLEPTGDVEPVVIDEATLRANLEAEFDRSNPQDRVAEAEGFLVTLGLLPPGASLRQLHLDLLGGQVVGYYSPDADELYLVSRSGVVGALERATYAHEFTHQLQDQAFDLAALGLDDPASSDLALARLALVEGDAVTAQSTWMQEALNPEEMGEIFAAALDPAALEILRRTPAVLREQALFPYREGLAFVTALSARGGYAAVDAAYAAPPDTTEQVLHPEKYFAREAPIDVEIPVGADAGLEAGWGEVGSDTFGEAFFRIWLSEGGLSASEARVAAAGWGGDRAVLYAGPGGAHSVLLATAWDSRADAREFADAAETAIDGLAVRGRVVFAEPSTTVFVVLGGQTDRLAPRLFGR